LNLLKLTPYQLCTGNRPKQTIWLPS